jgi:TetR/AcrR family transcriptional regulator, cholesterol catabolism regulator
MNQGNYLGRVSPVARKPADQTVNREDIIRAAAEVLHRSGYESTTMKNIAARVNLTAASLYHHFRNKDSLLLAVLEDGISRVTKQLEPIAQSDIQNTEKLTEMIKLHVLNVTQYTAVGAAMVFEMRTLMGESSSAKSNDKEAFINRRDAFFQRRDYFERLFRNVVQAGIDSGEFHSVDAAIFTKTMLGAHNWVGIWYKDGGRLDGEAIAEMMAETFLRALQSE